MQYKLHLYKSCSNSNFIEFLLNCHFYNQMALHSGISNTDGNKFMISSYTLKKEWQQFLELLEDYNTVWGSLNWRILGLPLKHRIYRRLPDKHGRLNLVNSVGICQAAIKPRRKITKLKKIQTLVSYPKLPS